MFYCLLTISYDGSSYKGWAKQKNEVTIQGELENAISNLFKRKDFHLLGASKTDAGVHALDQKVFIQTEFEYKIESIKTALNRKLPETIRVHKIEKIGKDFLVRNCKEKEYIYNISLSEIDPFKARYKYYPDYKFNVDKLTESLNLFIGDHDFRYFSGLREVEYEKFNTKRNIKNIFVEKIDSENLIVHFVAKGFIRYQIRKILGACFAYVKGKITLDEIVNVIELKNNKMLYIAKPNGLFLKKIIY